MAWEPDHRSNFFFSPPAHLCAVTWRITEISLNVPLIKQPITSLTIAESWRCWRLLTTGFKTSLVQITTKKHQSVIQCQSRNGLGSSHRNFCEPRNTNIPRWDQVLQESKHLLFKTLFYTTVCRVGNSSLVRTQGLIITLYVGRIYGKRNVKWNRLWIISTPLIKWRKLLTIMYQIMIL